MSDSVLDDGLTFNDTPTPGSGGSSYVLPVATTTTLGGVKPDGTTITAAADGTITSTATGGGGPAYTLPVATTFTLGGVMVDGTTITADPSGRISASAGGGGGVTSFNGRTGTVTLTQSDANTAIGYTPYDAANPSGYQSAAQVASATAGFLPTTGGNISGNLTVVGASQFDSTLGVTGICAFAFPTVTDFYMYRTGAFRVLHWSNSDQVLWAESGGTISWQHNSSSTMTLDTSGNLTIVGNGFKPGGGSWSAPSDDRIKQDVRPYTSGLDLICQLQPIWFQYNGEGGVAADGRWHIGLSAQSTQPIMPELVLEMPATEDTLPNQLATDFGPLALALCNAVRELTARVAALEAAAAP